MVTFIGAEWCSNALVFKYVVGDDKRLQYFHDIVYRTKILISLYGITNFLWYKINFVVKLCCKVASSLIRKKSDFWKKRHSRSDSCQYVYLITMNKYFLKIDKISSTYQISNLVSKYLVTVVTSKIGFFYQQIFEWKSRYSYLYRNNNVCSVRLTLTNA